MPQTSRFCGMGQFHYGVEKRADQCAEETKNCAGGPEEERVAAIHSLYSEMVLAWRSQGFQGLRFVEANVNELGTTG